MKIFLFLIAVIIPLNFIHSQNEDWKFSGQIQLRSEVDGRDFKHRTHPLTFASLRTRVGVEKTFLDKINFFVQIQDSRVFGQEGNTLASINNLDLHQGYVTLKQLFDWDMDVQAGRFEVAYGTERFLGAVGWHYVARSWDGVRFKLYPGFKLDLFALTHTESVSYIANATRSTYPYPQQPTPSYSVYGFWESNNLCQQHQLDFFGYYEINRMRNNEDDLTLDRFTIGTNYFGNFNNLSTIFEGAYQFGKSGGMDVSVFLISLQGNYKADEFKFGLGADILSGDEEPGEVHVFSPSFGTNHKFYGFMDYFINIPLNTLTMGLHDYYINASFLPEESKFSASLDFHYFTSNTSITVSTVQNPEGWEEDLFGQEIDLTVRYNFIKGTTITWGGSVFIPGELMKIMFSPSAYDVAFWSYLMITANL